MDVRTPDEQQRSQLAAGRNLRIIRLCIALGIAAGFGHNASAQTYGAVTYEELTNWAGDDHAKALDVFRTTCRDMKRPSWQTLCGLAGDGVEARTFFELFFQPVEIREAEDGLFTGYYEPELAGALTPDETFRFALYEEPDEAQKQDPWKTRQEIMATDLMQGQGLEIAWVADPVDLMFLQIQGSGRIKLREGGTLRVGYGGSNGHPYRSIGKALVEKGLFEPHEVSSTVIRNWVRDNGPEGEAFLFENPSYTFFHKIEDLGGHQGPKGAMNRPITAGRSLAIDPAYVTLGAPVWIEKQGKDPLHRLMVAQDTGAAIKGPQRADIFFGTGAEAGAKARKIKDPGRLIVLLPLQEAVALVESQP